jgi:hypothetical protein
MTSKDNPPVFYVRVTPGSGAVSPQSATNDFVKVTEEKLKQVAQLIETSLQGLVSEISNISIPPAEIALEFGIDVGAEGSVPFIAKASMGANFKISVVWRKAET